MTSRIGRFSYLDEVRAARVPDPDMRGLLTYEEATARYHQALVAIGFADDPKVINHQLRNLARNGVLRRWDMANRVRIAPEDVETYIRVAGQPRPIE